MTRRERRALQRRARLMVERAAGTPLTLHDRAVVLLVEGERPIATDWDATRALWLLHAGIQLHPDSESAVERLLESGRVPGIFYFDGLVHVDALDVAPLARGGVA